jgi:DNA-3-methyladenine glycosylase I
MPRPDHHEPVEKPDSDNEYFERMSRVIFMAGLNWATLTKKWPGIREAFADFDIAAVAEFDEPQIEALMKNPDVIRNLPKIRAIIKNAQTFQEITAEHGSFANYLKSLDGEDELRMTIAKRFAFMGKGTTVIFLFSVGEDLPKASAEWQARHQKG